MPFGDAATDFVKRRVDGRRVRVTLLAKDQYVRRVDFWRTSRGAAAAGTSIFRADE